MLEDVEDAVAWANRLIESLCSLDAETDGAGFEEGR